MQVCTKPIYSVYYYPALIFKTQWEIVSFLKTIKCQPIFLETIEPFIYIFFILSHFIVISYGIKIVITREKIVIDIKEQNMV